MDKTHVAHVNDGFTFLGHRVIRKRGSLGNRRVVTTMPKDKFKNFAAKLVNELSSDYSENKIGLIASLNRKITGWANFYQFTDYTAVMFGKLDQILFWKTGHWLAREFNVSIKSLIKQWFRRPKIGKAKTWVLYSRNSRGNLEGIALKRLVTSRKSQFRWRNLEMNPYISLKVIFYKGISGCRLVNLQSFMNFTAIAELIFNKLSKKPPLRKRFQCSLRS